MLVFLHITMNIEIHGIIRLRSKFTRRERLMRLVVGRIRILRSSTRSSRAVALFLRVGPMLRKVNQIPNLHTGSTTVLRFLETGITERVDVVRGGGVVG
jgi:hypothetical protein